MCIVTISPYLLESSRLPKAFNSTQIDFTIDSKFYRAIFTSTVPSAPFTEGLESVSLVHKDLTERLKTQNCALYESVQRVLQLNKEERIFAAAPQRGKNIIRTPTAVFNTKVCVYCQ